MEILEHSGPTRGLRHRHLELPEVASLEPPQRVPLHVDVVDAKVGRVNRVPVVAGSEDRVVGIVLSVIAKIDVFIGGVILVAAVVEVTQERWRLTVHLKTEQMLRTKYPQRKHTGPGLIPVYMFGECCSCCCIQFLPQLSACSILATRDL